MSIQHSADSCCQWVQNFLGGGAIRRISNSSTHKNSHLKAFRNFMFCHSSIIHALDPLTVIYMLQVNQGSFPDYRRYCIIIPRMLTKHVSIKKSMIILGAQGGPQTPPLNLSPYCKITGCEHACQHSEVLLYLHAMVESFVAVEIHFG